LWRHLDHPGAYGLAGGINTRWVRDCTRDRVRTAGERVRSAGQRIRSAGQRVGPAA